MAVIESVQEIQVKHLLGKGGGTNLDFPIFFEVPRKVNLNTNPTLRAGIKKFVQFHADHFTHSLGNLWEERPARDG